MSKTDRNGTPFGKWQDRYIGWLPDLSSLQKPGVEAKAAQGNRRFPQATPARCRSPRASGHSTR